MSKPLAVLASKSPRRETILKKIGLKFEIIPSNILEKINPEISPKKLAEFLSQEKAEWLRDQLVEKDFEVACIHGEMPQKSRNEIMHEFKIGNSRVLIATDLIARGIDVQSISVVINYDLPKYKETYIHRIGRSGRYGRKGTAINFVSEKEYQHLQNIEAFYSTQVDALPDNIKDLI